jgi:ribosomal protein S18 acetylase RimI-like enzyme
MSMKERDSDLFRKIRLATTGDLAAIARIHKIAYSRKHFTALLPEPVLIRYYSAFITEGTEILLALDEDGRIQGFSVYGTGIPDKVAAFKKSSAIPIVLTSLRYPWISARKALKAVLALLEHDNPLPPADFLLLSIAVSEPLRGIGKLLLNDTMVVARQRGFERVGLYVNDDNIRAINTYQGMGFRLKEFRGRQYYMEVDLRGSGCN